MNASMTAFLTLTHFLNAWYFWGISTVAKPFQQLAKKGWKNIILVYNFVSLIHSRQNLRLITHHLECSWLQLHKRFTCTGIFSLAKNTSFLKLFFSGGHKVEYFTTTWYFVALKCEFVILFRNRSMYFM